MNENKVIIKGIVSQNKLCYDLLDVLKDMKIKHKKQEENK